ncbi:class I SAM-dependent methyltransferase [Paenibacillus sp. PvR133]|jgi:SAM-dependent methyltransferase|uniref:class I SAM-dependent methyltransferase n=1 Tax=unclassified Paenibacillus TaxID=185978 RepID=UPI001AE12B33|nr:class I SAM-dependent methyltransferase [Paenibacillus sp. PvR133]MBP1177473.1 SAM-dependent methyltransferase [Paenibacillus sp. PvR133]
MGDYWNKRFTEEGMIWGCEPSQTVTQAIDLFKKNNVHDILVPGAGYGRNTKAFSSYFQVDGIEISSSAIDLAKEWDLKTNFIQESVLEFSTCQKYDGIYCYDLLHLFLLEDRKKLIQNCVKHLKELGVMYFTCFSDCDFNNGVGREIEEGTYEYKKGKYAHFFTEEDLKEHFNGLNILETGSIRETLIYAEKQQKEYELRYIFVQKIG